MKRWDVGDVVLVITITGMFIVLPTMITLVAIFGPK